MLTKLGNTEEKSKVMRSKQNIKVRPNGYKRHDPFIEDELCRQSLSFIHHTDLEWMSLNYRKQRAAKMSLSKRRMILVMFQDDYQYFPSLREIRDELIKAQLNEIENESKSWNDDLNFKALKSIYTANWIMLFDMAKIGNLNKPLTP